MTVALATLLVAVAPGAHAAVGSAAAQDADTAAHFEAKIRPILVAHCWKCHADDAKGNLRLDSREGALQGGDSGPAFVPGDPDASLLVRAVRYDDPAYQMPPSGKLPAASIAALEEWVKRGGSYPPAAAGAAVRRGEFTVTPADREHWSYRPVVRPPVPPGEGSPVDAFLDAQLAARNLAHNPRATPRELIRRAWFDLVGLPPSIEEVEAFERDPSAAAWRQVVDRLLAMPAYGERWGRHWLDVVRYAQTNGYERDDEKPWAWRYRDWVIAAFNADMPYDRFVREQLAGDLLEPRSDGGLIATGFWHLGTWDDEPDDGRLARYDELDDMLATIGQGFLGSTINCARCHDHKFDPIGQKDYYRLLGMIHAVRRYHPKHGLEKKPRPKPAEKQAQGKESVTLQEPAEERVEIDASAYLKLSQSGEYAMVVRDAAGAAPRTTVFIRGNPATPGAEVKPGIPEVLSGIVPDSQLAELSGRRALAEWIASPANPLTARVMVNRIWLHHFGRGLVPTPNDFGVAGVPPEHPQLLDWLAAEFVARGWSVKAIHREIMLSRAYQRSSRADRPDCTAADEANTLLWRQNVRRLEAEAIRDAMLAVSGRLNPAAGGPGFFQAVGRDAVSGQSKPGRGWKISTAEDQCRRSVYGFVKRTLLLPEMESFDYTNTTSPVGERAVTTVAPQALLLTNGDFARTQAAALAKRIDAEPGATSTGGPDAERFVTRCYELAFARRPTAAELEVATSYLTRQQSAWAASVDPIVLRPIVPGALVREYRGLLAAKDILDVSPAGWLVGGGVWSGGYEGILNLETATGPFALWVGTAAAPPAGCVDGTVRAELFIRAATELAGVVVRGLASGTGTAERFTGYELAIVPPLKTIELRRATAEGVKLLAGVKREVLPDRWLSVTVSATGGKISATLDGEPTPLLTADDPQPLAQAGHVGLRTWGAGLAARNVVLHPHNGEPLRIDPATPPDAREAAARARRDLCLLMLNLNEFVYVD
jgi:hypothetical protein